jgi:MtfA peptidase
MPIVDSVYYSALDIYVQFDENHKIANLERICSGYKKLPTTDSALGVIDFHRVGYIAVANLNNCTQLTFEIESFESEKIKFDNLANYITVGITLGLIILVAAFYKLAKKQKELDKKEGKWMPYATFDDGGKRTSYTINYLTYRPHDLRFSNVFVVEILQKYFPYYNRLPAEKQSKFLRRVNEFMHLRVYHVHEAYGNREMPILIAANAVMISFGFWFFTLEHFTNINIFVNEFVENKNEFSLRGLVKDNSISFSWKHFIEGQVNITDGVNLGLHELAHAYYADNILLNPNRKNSFTEHYPAFELLAKQFASKRKIDIYGMYSEIALANTDEFFAESVELFFEKPNELKKNHKEVFEALQLLLNQPNYPLNQIPT